MRPHRTHFSNTVYRLPGGTEDNDLWVEVGPADEGAGELLRSCWVPTAEERRAIAEGANVELIVWGSAHPPVALGVVDYPLGRPPEAR